MSALQRQADPGFKNQFLLNEDDLKAWLKYEQSEKIVEWLTNNGIPFQRCRNSIVTTVQAVNNGLIGINKEESGFEFE